MALLVVLVQAAAAQGVGNVYLDLIGGGQPLVLEMDQDHGHREAPCVLRGSDHWTAVAAATALVRCMPPGWTLELHEREDGVVELREPGLAVSRLLDAEVRPTPGVRTLDALARELEDQLGAVHPADPSLVVASTHAEAVTVWVPEGPMAARELIRGLRIAPAAVGPPTEVGVLWSAFEDPDAGRQSVILRRAPATVRPTR